MRNSRLSVPGRGLSLASVTEQRAKYIRKVVEILRPYMTSDEAHKVFLELLGSRWRITGISHICEDFALRASWALVNMWVLGRLHGDLSVRSSLSDAEQWFLGSNDITQHSLAYFLPVDTEQEALMQLRTVEYDSDFEDLIPYILDPYGPGSRLNVLRDQRMAPARKNKKEKGFFYTPADVAEFIVGHVLEKVNKVHSRPLCFDPACGTGPFILALLKHKVEFNGLMDASSAFEYATSSLYGVDISDLTSEICCFVLLYELLDHITHQDLKPVGIWHLLRTNIVSLDALYIDRESAKLKVSKIENALREIIYNILENEKSEDWYLSIDSKIFKDAYRAYKKATNNDDKSNSTILNYTYLPQLKTIIENNWNLFEIIFDDKNKFIQAMNDLNKIRRDESHNREITETILNNLGEVYEFIMSCIAKINPEIIPHYIIENWRNSLFNIVDKLKFAIPLIDEKDRYNINKNLTAIKTFKNAISSAVEDLEELIYPLDKKKLHCKLLLIFKDLNNILKNMIQYGEKLKPNELENEFTKYSRKMNELNKFQEEYLLSEL